MSKIEKILEKVLLGRSDGNIDFDDLCRLLVSLSFEMRVKDSHHIFFRDGIDEIINIQPKQKSAKPYQVKQVRNLILKHRLGGKDD